MNSTLFVYDSLTPIDTQERLNKSLKGINIEYPSFNYLNATSYNDLWFVRSKIATPYGLHNNMVNIRLFGYDGDKQQTLRDKIRYKHYKSFKGILHDIPSSSEKRLGVFSTVAHNSLIGLCEFPLLKEKVYNINELTIYTLAPNADLDIKSATQCIPECEGMVKGIEYLANILQENVSDSQKSQRTPNLTFYNFYNKL